jgi:2,3,4,5-tetrahydropyridine-2-carboxylate N-succinyltransferase
MATRVLSRRMMMARTADDTTPELPSIDVLRAVIEGLDDRATVGPVAERAVEAALRLLEEGAIRPAEPDPSVPGGWRVNEWVKKAVLWAFRTRPVVPMEYGGLHFHDKLRLRGDLAGAGVRVVPTAIVREGAYVAPGCVLMPSYVNIGAYVGEETMIDTWATVGSCAQIGRRCHISGGVGIGGVLEPLQAAPVIIEDDCFVGARCEVAEGVRLGAGTVLAMGCYVGGSTPLYDATNGTRRRAADGIPERAVVVPGSLPAADGSHSTYALIIKKYRDARTDARTSLNDVLRGG